MALKISVQEIIQAYRESLGQEGAYKLIHEALIKLNLQHLQQLDKEEMLKLCDQLKEKGGFVAILADLLLARFNLRT